MATRHVLEGEKHLANQIDLIDRLGERGFPTDEDLLASFYASQAEHKSHLQRIRHEQETGHRDVGRKPNSGVRLPSHALPEPR